MVGIVLKMPILSLVAIQYVETEKYMGMKNVMMDGLTTSVLHWLLVVIYAQSNLNMNAFISVKEIDHDVAGFVVTGEETKVRIVMMETKVMETDVRLQIINAKLNLISNASVEMKPILIIVLKCP